MGKNIRHKSQSLVIVILLVIMATVQTHARNPSKGFPRLIHQITVDQLRGDMPVSVNDRLGEGGFRYLYENGIVYENAHHRHANAETVVGHATLATGAERAGHGIVGNFCFDRELGRVVYNIEDDRYSFVGGVGMKIWTSV